MSRRKRALGDDDVATSERSPRRPPPSPSKTSTRTWRFAVKAPSLRPGELVCVSGDCTALGSWAADSLFLLTETSDAEGVWAGTCDLPVGVDVHYRYCVCSFDQSRRHTFVRSWETELKPRRISADSESPPEKPQEYGRVSERYRVDRGWLVSGALVQFKFYKNPFAFKNRVRDGALRVKLIPVDFQFGCDNANAPADESLNADTNDGETSSAAITEVATLDSERCHFEPQEQFGRSYESDDFLIFNVTAPDPHALAYLVDFYKTSSHGAPGDPPKHVGYSYILPNLLKKSEGQIELPITCSTKHRPLGSMNLDYLIIYPMRQPLCDMRVSYSSYWNETWKGLDIGHRGLGSSFKALDTPIRENTIASLKTAADSGADMLEFDVQLSKDLVPVVYHDFHVCIALKNKKQTEHTEMLEIPMKDLTCEQLQKLKVYHVVEGRAKEPRFFDEDLAEHQPFPLLSEVLKVINPHVALNIEVKWTMLREDGSLELQHPFDLNLYIDKILEVVLRHAGQRRIIFSCFHPDICTMLRMKQNIYPTMFLTQGVTVRYPNYHDLRCNTIPAAVYHALSVGLLGLVVHTEDLLRDSSQVKLVTDAGLIIFCWGEDNNNKNTIKYLKALGLHGVIYDKLDQYSTKEVKESIFSVEARESEKELIRIASVDESQNLNKPIEINNVNHSQHLNSNSEGISSE